MCPFRPPVLGARKCPHHAATGPEPLPRLGFRAVLAGTMANYLAAAIAGLLLA